MPKRRANKDATPILKLVQFREMKGLSRKQMANAMNISKRHYSEVENGNVNCGLTFVLKFEKAFCEADAVDIFAEHIKKTLRS